MPATPHLPISVVVITLNAARALQACLQSVRDLADEILVVDSGSEDATREIAEDCGARVVHQAWLGFGAQKDFAVRQARNDWVLCLDADERVSEALAASIRAEMVAPHVSGYRMARRNRFMGRYLNHGAGYPDWSIRLFNRNDGAWSRSPVHERVILNGSLGVLQGDLLHDSAETIEAFLEKQNRYSGLQAAADRTSRRWALPGVLLSPGFRFFKTYVLKRGFLDGRAGLVHALIGSMATRMKYLKILASTAPQRRD